MVDQHAKSRFLDQIERSGWYDYFNQVNLSGPALTPLGLLPTERVRCRYLIGADGGDAFTCEKLGLDFKPEKLPDCMNRQVDAKLHWRRSTDPDQIWFSYYE